MKISEIIRPRIKQVAVIKDEYYCVHIFGNEFLVNYLIWSGEKPNRVIRKSHKQGRLRIKDLDLSETKLRYVIGSFRYEINQHLLVLDNSDSDFWKLEYNPAVNPFELDEIIDILCRVQNIGCPEFLIPEKI